MNFKSDKDDDDEEEDGRWDLTSSPKEPSESEARERFLSSELAWLPLTAGMGTRKIVMTRMMIVRKMIICQFCHSSPEEKGLICTFAV